MHRDLLEPDLLRRLVARVPDDDHAFGVDHDRLAEAELAERGRHGVNGVVVEAGVVGIRPDIGQLAKFGLHQSAP